MSLARIQRVDNGALLTIDLDGETLTEEVFEFDDEDRQGWVDLLFRLTDEIGPKEAPWSAGGAIKIEVVDGHEYEGPRLQG